MQISPHKKKIFWIFFSISEIYITVWILWTKTWASEVIWFWYNRLQKSEFLKWPKSPVSEHLWTVNMLKGAKHCLNLHGRIFCQILSSFKKKIKIWKSKNIFSIFFHFQNVHKIWNTLKKKMSLRSYLFLKLKTAKRQVA